MQQKTPKASLDFRKRKAAKLETKPRQSFAAATTILLDIRLMFRQTFSRLLRGHCCFHQRLYLYQQRPNKCLEAFRKQTFSRLPWPMPSRLQNWPGSPVPLWRSRSQGQG